MRCVRCNQPVFEDDQGLYSQFPVTSPEMPGFTFMDRAHGCGEPPAPHQVPCDYDTGTAGSGPSKCGRPAEFLWADETRGADRPVCGAPVPLRGVLPELADAVEAGAVRSLKDVAALLDSLGARDMTDRGPE